jgi:hypothetical protein
LSFLGMGWGGVGRRIRGGSGWGGRGWGVWVGGNGIGGGVVMLIGVRGELMGLGRVLFWGVLSLVGEADEGPGEMEDQGVGGARWRDDRVGGW